MPVRTPFDSRRTPVNLEYPSCSDCYASLNIYSSSESANFITVTLELESDESFNKGVAVQITPKRTKVYDFSFWRLGSENKVDSLDLRSHLDFIIDLLKPRKEALFKLQQMDGFEMVVSCYWLSSQGNGGPTFWPEQMRALSDLNLELTLDVYFYEILDSLLGEVESNIVSE